MDPKTHLFAAILCAWMTAETIHAHGGYHAEIRSCDEKLAADPKNAAVWFQRGRLNYLHGDWKQSLSDLDRAESLSPGKFPIGLARGQALMSGGDLQAAKAALDAFIGSSPNVAEAYSSRAALLMKLEDPSAAAKDFQKTTALRSNPEPDDYVAWAQACQQAGEPRQALHALDEGMKKLGALGSLADLAIDIELSIRDYDAALNRVSSQQALAPRPEPWMAKRASILATAGRIELSRTAWQDLREHLLRLPEAQRGSHAMSQLLNQSQVAIAAIDANSSKPAQ